MPLSDTPPRRRADAERSRAAIMDAAARLLAERPESGIAAVAAAAGVTRQTVYAHFATRDDLLDAALGEIAAQALRVVEAARLDDGPAPGALRRLLDGPRQAVVLHPALHPVLPRDARDRSAAPCAPCGGAVHDRLVQLVRRGQRDGDFDAGLDPEWALAAIIALGRLTGLRVASGDVPQAAAADLVRTAALRLLGAPA